MTKQILIDPVEVRKKSVLKAPEIPINAYVSNPTKEVKKYGRKPGAHLPGYSFFTRV